MNNGLCFVGTLGIFSLTALQTLLENAIKPSRIILAGFGPAVNTKTGFPVSLAATIKPQSNSIQTLAEQHQIPVHFTSGGGIKDFSTWENFPHDTPPDFLFVACFPFRLPTSLLQWPRQAAINLHPSLLPAFRGPDPVFWQLQQGEKNTGISLHLITETIDGGPVLLQKLAVFPPGATRDELDGLLAQQGTEAFCTWLLTPNLGTTEQPSHTASYQPLPEAANYALDPGWPAEHAYHFIRGTRTPDGGYPILINNLPYTLDDAISFDAHQSIDEKVAQHGKEICIQFSPGVLRANTV